MKYLVTYMGVVSGSMMGRDDGYPEQKSVICDSKDDVLRYFDEPEFKVREIIPCSVDWAKEQIKAQKAEQKKKAQQVAIKKNALAKLTAEEREELGLNTKSFDWGGR